MQTQFGWLLPSGSALAGAGVESSAPRTGSISVPGFRAAQGKFDYIFVDCPPSLELLTLNGLCAADGILVPVQCEYYALEGLSDLMATLRAVKRRVNPNLEIYGVVLTMYDGRTNFSAQVAQEVRRHFPGKVFRTAIPRNVRLAEAPSHGLPVGAYDRTSRGAVAYHALAEEVMQKRMRPWPSKNWAEA